MIRHVGLTLALFLLLTARASTFEARTAVLHNTQLSAPSDSLFHALKQMDSLLFELGFNSIDTAQLSRIIAEDFEFYHDKSGVTGSKHDFLLSIAHLSELPFKTWRIVKDNTLEVFPMYRDNGDILYGAMQIGAHEFYQQHPGQVAERTNVARFSHLWILEADEWKLSRVISYDHQVPEKE